MNQQNQSEHGHGIVPVGVAYCWRLISLCDLVKHSSSVLVLGCYVHLKIPLVEVAAIVPFKGVIKHVVCVTNRDFIPDKTDVAVTPEYPHGEPVEKTYPQKLPFRVSEEVPIVNVLIEAKQRVSERLQALWNVRAAGIKLLLVEGVVSPLPTPLSFCVGLSACLANAIERPFIHLEEDL
jgi:hypothetical protein